ncbi:CinA family protein [Nocardioides gansuensis]|uniref:CinA family protein n=1 Tax=Nocardioides gansuensis TaxID=2138300 RepID=A0A2T8F8M3_9ACTN|nr:CinA family protein [Nocardioides gansuensis]PVG82045.1 CinA family protein [Nocardioides gansuensis]
MSQALQDRLVELGSTVATAESLTGGALAVRLTQLPGSSDVFLGGVVAYATEVKESVLGVPEQVVREHGVISGECAVAMASGVRDLLSATYGLSTTGVAGPEPQEGQPPGTVWIAVAGPEGVETRLLELEGDRTDVQSATCDEALSLLGGILRMEGSVLG